MGIYTILQIAVNLFLISSGILLLLMSLILWLTQHSSVRRLVFLGLFVLSCSLWFLIRNPTFGVCMVKQPFFETVDVMCQYTITFFSLSYIREFVYGWRKKIILFCQLWTATYIVVTSLLQFNTVLNYNDFMPIGAIINAIFIVLMGFCIGWDAVREKEEDARKLVLSSLPALIGGLIEIESYFQGYSTPTSVPFHIGFFLFILLQVFWFVQHLAIQAQRRAELEKELMNSRISIMLSQIQPHFLYNSLTGIKLLCDTDPSRASEALEHFSFYLRGNLDALTNIQLITFEKELVHIKDYLFLEKMRFSKKLNIVWDLTYLDFRIPPLTVQPLIENAIRHGIIKKKGGGTLTIRSELLGHDVIISIEDDGVGFDLTEQKSDGRSHIGIENTRERLKILCNGSLLIESMKGRGTVVKIFLPQKLQQKD